jgi:hypothetical protein
MKSSVGLNVDILDNYCYYDIVSALPWDLMMNKNRILAHMSIQK